MRDVITTGRSTENCEAREANEQKAREWIDGMDQKAEKDGVEMGVSVEGNAMPPATTRRAILKGIGSAIAIGSAFTGRVAASDDTLAKQLDTARSFTHKYGDVATARDDGYEEFGVEPPVGHVLQRTDYFDAEEFIGPTRLTEPPALLFYAPLESEGDSDDADLLLAGVEYHVAGDRTSDPPDLFDDENASRELEVTEEEGWHRSPTPDVLDVTGLHVWVHLHNPEGVFHVGHPTIERLVREHE